MDGRHNCFSLLTRINRITDDVKVIQMNILQHYTYTTMTFSSSTICTSETNPLILLSCICLDERVKTPTKKANAKPTKEVHDFQNINRIEILHNYKELQKYI